jgi:hypothetical protein
MLQNVLDRSVKDFLKGLQAGGHGSFLGSTAAMMALRAAGEMRPRRLIVVIIFAIRSKRSRSPGPDRAWSALEGSNRWAAAEG